MRHGQAVILAVHWQARKVACQTATGTLAASLCVHPSLRACKADSTKTTTLKGRAAMSFHMMSTLAGPFIVCVTIQVGMGCQRATGDCNGPFAAIVRLISEYTASRKFRASRDRSQSAHGTYRYNRMVGLSERPEGPEGSAASDAMGPRRPSPQQLVTSSGTPTDPARVRCWASTLGHAFVGFSSPVLARARF